MNADANFANQVIALSSIAELAEHVHPASLTPMSYASKLPLFMDDSLRTLKQLHQRCWKVKITQRLNVNNIRETI